MKHACLLFLTSFVFLFSSNLCAQVPQGINYQAVLRDAQGQIMANQNVTVEFRIMESAALVYSETHSLATNDFGLLTAVIGRGTPTSGLFDNIDWTIADHELEPLIDIGGGMVSLGLSDLISVPFAMHATTASEPDFGMGALDDVNLNTPPANGQLLTWNGNEWVPTTPAAGTVYTGGTGIDVTGSVISNTAPDQTVSLTGTGATSVTGTYPNFSINSTDNVNDADADPTNEIQTLSISGNQLSLSNGGNSVNLPTPSSTVSTTPRLSGDGSGGNPLDIAQQGAAVDQVLKWDGSSWSPADDSISQPTLSLVGNLLSISGGNSINLPNNTYTAGTGISISGSNVIQNTGDTNASDDINSGDAAGGDLSGTYPNPQVDGLRGNPVSATVPSSGQVLKWNGSSWAPSADVNSQVWSTSGTSAYYNSGKVGIGTASPSDFVQIDAASLTNAFRVRIGGSTKLRVNSNGSVTVGTLGAGPDNGLYVAGSVGVGTSAPTGRFQIIPLGNLNQGGTLDATKAGLIIGSTSTGIFMDANQIESKGSALNLNYTSTSYVTLANGGGRVAIGHTSPSAKLDVQDDNDWTLRVMNTGNGGDDWYIGASNAGWAAGRRKFLISPTSSSLSAVFSIDSVGRVGIGTSAPAIKLHILGGNDVGIGGGGYLTMGSLAGANIGIDNNEIMARNNGSASTLYLNAEGGKISLRTSGAGNLTHDVNITGSQKLYLGASEDFIVAKSPSNTDPSIYATASEYGLVGKSSNEMFNIRSKRFYAESSFNYLAYSDRRLKENVRSIASPVATLQQIDGVEYDLRSEYYDVSDRSNSEFIRTHQIGFIAQDIQQVLPQLVHEDEETGFKTVGYMGLIPVLVEAVKEQQKTINSLEEKLELLTQRLEALEN